MAFRIHTAGRIEQFLETAPDDFLPDTPLGHQPIWVIQNRNMGEWLKLELARRRGLSAGLEIRFPEQAVRQYMNHFDHPFKEHTILYMDNMKVVVYRKLKKIQADQNPVYQPLLNYLHWSPSAQESDSLETRLYQLADVIGGLFYHYGMNCVELTASWEKGELYPCGEQYELEHQQWQMELWRELFHRQSPYVHLSRILIDISNRELGYQGPVNPVRLFGSSFLGETGIRFFHYLSRFLPVDFYYVIPSRILSPLEAAEAPMDQWEGWSSLARGLSGLLRELSPEKGACQMEPTLGRHYLGSIQSLIWNNRMPQDLPRDDSLKIFSAPSERRQVEVLKDRLLELLDRSPDLQLNDICIMAPDIQPFAAHIERVFLNPRQQETRLPCHFIDLKREGDALFTEGFLQLLELGESRFSRSEVFSLFQNPCFAWANRIHQGQYKEWLQNCEELNILWGIDGAHKAALGFPPVETNSWEWGFRRALSGMLYSSDRDHYCSPWTDISESSFSSMGRMIQLVRGLYHDLDALRKSRMNLEAWVIRVEELMERYLSPRHEEEQDRLDRLSVKMVFRNLNNLVEDLHDQGQDDRKVPWEFFRQLLTELISKTGRKKGHYLTQGISCSSLKPLRGIPFRVICLLGMDYGNFPRLEQESSFDLKHLTHETIDLSRRASDKFSFLETLMSARDQLWVFYKGRSQVSGDPLLPSPVITELIHLAKFPEEGVVKLPLHSHDFSHFQKKSPLPSFDRGAWERFMLQRNSSLALTPPELILQEEKEITQLDMKQLIRFFNNPLAEFAKQELGLYMKDEELLEEHQNEAYRIPFLQERGFFRDSLPLLLDQQHPDPELWMEDLRKKGFLSHTPWDEGLRQGLIDELQHFTQALEPHLKRLGRAVPREIRFVQGVTNPVEKGAILELPPLKISTARHQLELTGEIQGFREGRGFLELQYLYGNQYKSRYGFPGFLHYLALAASGNTEQLDMIYMGRGPYPEKYWNASVLKPGETPRSLLTSLVEMYLANRQAPIPLYPDLADKVTQKGKKGQYWQDPGAFSREYLGKWLDDYDGGPECSYGELFFPFGADPGEGGRQLMNHLYYYCGEIIPEGN